MNAAKEIKIADALPMKTVEDWVLDANVSKDGELIVGYAHNYVESFKVINGGWEKKYTQYTEEKCMLYCMALYCEESMVACGTVFTEILVWKYGEKVSEPGKLLFRLKGHKGILFKLLWLSKYLLASGSDDRTIRLWQLKDKSSSELISTLYGHAARIWDLDYFPSQNLIVSVGEDSSCILWDVATKKLLHKVHGVAGKDMWRVACYNGVIAAGANDSSIQMYLADWLLMQKKSLFDSSPPEIGKNGLYCKWQLPLLTEGLKKNEVEYTKFIDISWENSAATPTYVLLLCTSKGRIFKINCHSYSYSLIYAHEKHESAVCVRCVPPIILSGKPVHLLVAALAKGNMAVMSRDEDTKVKPVFWKAEDEHINKVHLIDVDVGKGVVEFVTCSAEGSIKEWSACMCEMGSKIEIKIELKGSHRTHNKYEISSLVKYDNKYLICGDMIGSLHIFEKGTIATAASFVKRFHKCQRVECVKVDKGRIYSVGKDGRLNRYTISKDPISLNLIETMNVNEFALINDIIFSEHEKKEQITLFGCKENYGFIWNYTDEYPIFTFDCKGGNRALAFLQDIENKECFIFAYSAKDQIMIFNLLKSQILSQPITSNVPTRLYNPFLNTTFHSKEVLSMEVKRSFTPGHALIVTGSDDTKVKILRSDTYRPGINCLKTITVHRSCAKAMQLIKTPISNFYYLITAGGRTEFHIFELYDDESGVRTSYLTNICLRGEDDARIMCIDTVFCSCKEKLPSIFLLSGTSAGDILLMEYNIEQNRAEIRSKIHLEVAILVCKLILVKEGEFKALIGTTEGALHSFFFQESPEGLTKKLIAEESLSKVSEKAIPSLKLSMDRIMPHKQLFTAKLHQCGLNGFSLKKVATTKYLIFTGADDQAVMVSIWDFVENSLKTIAAVKEAHSSSIRATKLIRTKEGIVGLSSGYDQRLKIWKIRWEEKKMSKVAEFVHGVSDISTICVHEDKCEQQQLVYLAGSGLEIIKLNIL